MGTLIESGKTIKAIRLGVPRSDTVQALMWLLALASDEKAQAVFTDDINPYDAFALAGILGTASTKCHARRGGGARRLQWRGRAVADRRATPTQCGACRRPWPPPRQPPAAGACVGLPPNANQRTKCGALW